MRVEAARPCNAETGRASAIERVEAQSSNSEQAYDADDGRGARYLGWLWDPDPGDSWVQTAYAFLLRDADQSVRVVDETHRLGLFSRHSWLRLLAEAGFEASSAIEPATDDRTPRELFIGRRR